ncbi:MAG: polymer-forming cytoskeletal protein [Lachnospiraceae bacterium]|nr:polymer-forming cytoskeletal protein [Lachnospiraceae bacterium]
MGFFSDLKEDLSQAVNELMPEEALEAAMAGDAETPGELSDAQITNDAPMTDEPSETVDSVDLGSMLDGLTEPDTADEPLEEVVISPDIMAETTEDILETTEAEIAEEPAIVEVTEEPEPIPEVEPEAESEIGLQEDNITSELNGEEENNMEEQAQVQSQALANRVAVDETAVVTEGMTITGDIISEGSMELIGVVNGNLEILGKLNITGTIQGDSKAAEIYAEGAKITGEVNSQGSVKIGQSSVVIGNITANSAVIAGAVKGDIDVQGPVILDTTAIVMGNIKSKSVQINNGAVIEGLCSQCYADVNPTSFFEEFKKKK